MLFSFLKKRVKKYFFIYSVDGVDVFPKGLFPPIHQIPFKQNWIILKAAVHNLCKYCKQIKGRHT